VSTSKRPQVINVQYPRIPSKVFLKAHRVKRSSVVVGTINDEADKMMLILDAWSVKTPRYLA
jgi:hypothetical protein